MWKPIAVAALAILGAALLAVGASGSSDYRPSNETAIAAALRAPELDGLARSFPRRQQGHRCSALAFPGGPRATRGTSLPRTCWTSVVFHSDGSATVRFTRSPRWLGKREIGETWVFRVSRSLHVRLLREPRFLPEDQS